MLSCYILNCHVICCMYVIYYIIYIIYTHIYIYACVYTYIYIHCVRNFSIFRIRSWDRIRAGRRSGAARSWALSLGSSPPGRWLRKTKISSRTVIRNCALLCFAINYIIPYCVLLYSTILYHTMLLYESSPRGSLHAPERRRRPRRPRPQLQEAPSQGEGSKFPATSVKSIISYHI